MNEQSKKPETAVELQEEQLDQVSGGGKITDTNPWKEAIEKAKEEK